MRAAIRIARPVKRRSLQEPNPIQFNGSIRRSIRFDASVLSQTPIFTSAKSNRNLLEC